MEDKITTEEKLQLLPKPDLKYDKLNYIKEKREIYVNLFEFGTKKDLKLFKYPFIITPEVEKNAVKLIHSILKAVYKEIHSIYGVFIISGGSLY